VILKFFWRQKKLRKENNSGIYSPCFETDFSVSLQILNASDQLCDKFNLPVFEKKFQREKKREFRGKKKMRKNLKIFSSSIKNADN